MKSIKKLLIFWMSLATIYAYPQNTDMVKKKGPADEYSRSSVSYLLLDFQNEKYSSMLVRAMNSTTVPSKFDNNDLAQKTVAAPYYHVPNQLVTSGNAEKIRQTLVANQYALDVVKYWWKIQDDGSYSTDLIKKRGEYNATDDVVSTVDATKVGRAKLADMGVKLIGNSYVMVLDYDEVMSIDDEYDATDAAARALAEKTKTEFKPVKRIKNGFKGKITSYLFRINYSDTVQGYFDASFIDEKTIDLQKFNKIFNEVYSPITFVTSTSAKFEATQPNPGEFLAPTVQQTPDQMMGKFMNSGIEKSIDAIETKLEAFRVKTFVTGVDPIKAKIGRKEGLKHERRYFVWKYAESNGAVVAKKQGVLRARKVTDNRNDELGKTSESSFYQVGGGRVDLGMTLQERKDAGIGISFGFGSLGTVIRGDINVGQWVDLPWKQFKLYGEFITGKKEYADGIVNISLTPPTDDKYSQGKFAIGILKEYPFARKFWAGWQLGWTGETITWEGSADGEQLSASGLNWALRLGTNFLSPSFQIFGSVNGHNYGSVTYKSGGDNSKDTDLGKKWSDIFPDKSPVSFDLTLRLIF